VLPAIAVPVVTVEMRTRDSRPTILAAIRLVHVSETDRHRQEHPRTPLVAIHGIREPVLLAVALTHFGAFCVLPRLAVVLFSVCTPIRCALCSM